MLPETMGTAEMAVLLHKSERTIKKDVSVAPWTLPPRVRIPGSRRVMWLRSTVYDWLKKHQEKEHVPQP
jgi:predicted DNA-binding transcriptional regulator AlpA